MAVAMEDDFSLSTAPSGGSVCGCADEPASERDLPRLRKGISDTEILPADSSTLDRAASTREGGNLFTKRVLRNQADGILKIAGARILTVQAWGDYRPQCDVPWLNEIIYTEVSQIKACICRFCREA